MSRRPHARPVEFHGRPGLVWPCAVDPAGVMGPTPHQARGPRWQRTSSGYYVPSDLDPALAVDQRIVSAAFLVLGTGAVTGWAGLRWGGARYLGENGEPVPLAVTTGVRKQPGIELSRERLADDDLELVDGLAITRHVRSAAYAARYAACVDDAVKVIDRAAAADLVSLAELAAYALTLRRAAGIGRLRAALPLAVENSWSPMETEMRLLWRTIGLTEVACNQPVFDLTGRHVGTPDLLDLVTGTVGEYDGPTHLRRSQRDKDIRREGAFRRVGLEYVEMTAPDRADPADFLQRTRDAVARAAYSRRGWTLETPPWWRPTVTVEQRRRLSPRDRDRLLGWQRN